MSDTIPCLVIGTKYSHNELIKRIKRVKEIANFHHIMSGIHSQSVGNELIKNFCITNLVSIHASGTSAL